LKFSLRDIFSREALNTNVATLGLTSMVSTFSISLWQGYIPVYFSGLGYQEWSIGLLFSYAAVVTVVAFFVSGWLGDRVGRKSVIVWSTFALAFSSFLLSVPLMFVLGAGFLLLYWSLTSLQPNFRALITDSVSQGYRGRALGIFNSLAVALGALAILLSGVLVNSRSALGYSQKLPPLFLFSTATIFLAGVARHFGLRETQKPSESVPLMTVLKRNLQPLSNVKLRLLTLAYMIHDAGLSVVLFLIPIYAVSYMGASSVLLGSMLALNFIVNFLLQAQFGHLADSFGRTKVIVVSFFVESFAIGSLILVKSPLYLLTMYGIWVAVGQMDLPAEGALLADLSQQESRATMMGSFGGLTTVASIPAPFVGGLLVKVYPSIVGGYGVPFLLAFALLFGASLLVLYYRAKVYFG
jgi:MFS family permease